MLPKLPLDDEIGRTFYINGAPWRLAYNPEIRGIALRRIASSIPFERALELIASGGLLWDPFEHVPRLGPGLSVQAVHQYVALLGAFRRSPTCMNATDWMLLARVDERLAESRTWLARRSLRSGEAKDDPTNGNE
jgi:hypothetical protein